MSNQDTATTSTEELCAAALYMQERCTQEPLSELQSLITSCSFMAAASLIRRHMDYFKEEFSTLLASDNDICRAVNAKPCELLYSAIDCDYADLVSLLVAHGCDVNFGKNQPFRPHVITPLYCAVQGSNTDIIQTLLKAGCDRNVVNSTGSTAVYEAAFEGRSEILQLLLQYGCDANVPDCYGQTPLHILPFSYGSQQDKLRCIHLLLENGADLTLNSRHDQTAADIAIQYKFTVQLQYLMDNAQVLNIRKIPHSRHVLGGSILPEMLLWAPCTEGFYMTGLLLTQLHPNHDIPRHTSDEFRRIYFSDDVKTGPDLDFHADARKLYWLMVLSGIRGVLTKQVLSLYEISRVAIRRHLGEQCWYLCPHLPVPHSVQDYLQLKDIIQPERYSH